MHRFRKNVFDGHVRFSACDLLLHDFHCLSTGSLFIMGGDGLRGVGDMVVNDRVARSHGGMLVDRRVDVNRFLARRRGVNLGSRMLSCDTGVLCYRFRSGFADRVCDCWRRDRAVCDCRLRSCWNGTDRLGLGHGYVCDVGDLKFWLRRRLR